MTSGETIAVHCKNHVLIRTKTTCGPNAGVLYVKAGGTQPAAATELTKDKRCFAEDA